MFVILKKKCLRKGASDTEVNDKFKISKRRKILYYNGSSTLAPDRPQTACSDT